MQNAVQGAITALTSILSRLSPVAKAVVAAVLPLVSALVNMAFAGSFDTTSIVVLATGAVSALAVYLVPNHAAKVAPAPAPVPAAK